MKIKRFLNLSIVVSFFIFSGSAQAVPVEMSVYFLPKDAHAVEAILDSYVDHTEKTVLVAAYWLTSKTFIDRLIELKKSGIDVQVIYDKSTPNSDQLMNRFFAAGITPVIANYDGKMHNKFIVLDDANVWTGSANFTDTAHGRARHYVNDENVITISSPVIAKRYIDSFFEMEKDIFELYIAELAESDKVAIPRWQQMLVSELYDNNPRFKTLVQESIKDFETDELGRLSEHFPEFKKQYEEKRAADLKVASQKRSAFGHQKPASEYQKATLEKAGIDTSGMTYNEAYGLIGQLLKDASRKRKRSESGSEGDIYE